MMTSIVKSQSLMALLSDLVVDKSTLQECTLSDISMDSRRVAAGGLFLALAKNTVDREKHLRQALEKDIFAVLIDDQQPLTETELQMLTEAVVMAYSVENLAEKAGFIAARFYDHPSKDMTVIAVTGTNGKTSVSQFIAQALESINKPCGVIGTMGAGRLCDLEMTGMTTPDPVTMQKLLAKFKREGCEYVALEASSHALAQGRLNSVDINVAVLTNLSRDHLDYHKTMANYAAAKKRLFDMESVEYAVINADDAFGTDVISKLKSGVNLLTYGGAQNQVNIRAEQIAYKADGVSFEAQVNANKLPVSLPVLGEFNVDNILAAIGVLTALGLDQQQCAEAINQCQAVSGRMQTYTQPGQATVVIDYAHTPDALHQALKTLQVHLPKTGQLWCVFGCGGDRDRGKRPLMGKVAEREANQVIITDDNPRTEDHLLIIEDILAGCDEPQKIRVELDRKLAIGHAINHAKPEDIVLIAGKGHESYQEINHVRYPFSDTAVVKAVFDSYSTGIKNVVGGH